MSDICSITNVHDCSHYVHTTVRGKYTAGCVVVVRCQCCLYASSPLGWCDVLVKFQYMQPQIGLDLAACHGCTSESSPVTSTPLRQSGIYKWARGIDSRHKVRSGKVTREIVHKFDSFRSAGKGVNNGSVSHGLFPKVVSQAFSTSRY